jgi:hypothetical protein
MSGGRDKLERKGKKQKAIIELLCDPDRTGWEGQAKPEEKESKLTKRDDHDAGDGDDDGHRDGSDADKSLHFISYKDEKVRGEEWGVLRLEWQTKYACEGASSDPSNRNSHWGFFTWFIIM